MSFSEACSWSTASSAIVVAARDSFGDSASASLFLRMGDAFSSPKPAYWYINEGERDNTMYDISDRSEQHATMCYQNSTKLLFYLFINKSKKPK